MLKNLFGFALALLRYALFGLVSLTANVLVWLLSPLLACLVVEESWNGLPREWLPRWCRWLQTHDAPVDEWWHGGYYKTAFKWSSKLTDSDFEQSTCLRYVARMLWLQRNPAYGLATYALGYRYATAEDRGVFYGHSHGQWDTSTTNYEFWLSRNPEVPLWMRYGFMFRGQFFYTRTRYVRVFIGWKLMRSESKVMVVTHINPFRKWAST